MWLSTDSLPQKATLTVKEIWCRWSCCDANASEVADESVARDADESVARDADEGTARDADEGTARDRSSVVVVIAAETDERS
jgi:hypothetical protein